MEMRSKTSGKRRIRYAVRACVFLICTSQLFAQTTPAINVDVAQFKSFQQGFTRIEIYQGVDRSSLQYKPGAGGYVAKYRIETEISNNDHATRLAAIFGTDTVSSRSQIRAGQEFVYATTGDLKPGSYKVTTTLHDEYNNAQASVVVPVEVRHISQDELLVSDIQLAIKIEKATAAATQFDKNNLRVIPNVQGCYGDDLETFSFYAEVYNLDFEPQNPGAYRVNYIIEDFDGEVLFTIPGKPRVKKQPEAVVYVSFDISSLPTGQYNFRAEVVDEERQHSASALKPFTVYRSSEATALQLEREKNIYNSMDEAALDHYLSQIDYIATQEERSVLGDLSVEGKRAFLLRFWRDRDPSPGTPRNEFKEDYILRLMKTRIHFSFGETEGWKSDRGRILLTYGAPEFIEREAKSSRRNAYEVWEYHDLRGQGTHIFVFIDTSENASYPLIHSSFRDEISNSEWERYLYK